MKDVYIDICKLIADAKGEKPLDLSDVLGLKRRMKNEK